MNRIHRTTSIASWIAVAAAEAEPSAAAAARTLPTTKGVAAESTVTVDTRSYLPLGFRGKFANRRPY